MRLFVLLALVIATSTMSLAAYGQDSSGDDPVVATVNGEPIRRSEVVMFHATLPASTRMFHSPKYSTICSPTSLTGK